MPSEQPEHRMLWRYAPQLLLGGVRPHSLEEHAHLRFPALQVGAQDRQLALVVELHRPERLAAPAETQSAFATSAQVTHPLSLAARGDEVALAVERQQVHRGASPDARAAAAYFKDARAPYADPEPGECRDGGGEELLREPAGALEVGVHGR